MFLAGALPTLLCEGENVGENDEEEDSWVIMSLKCWEEGARTGLKDRTDGGTDGQSDEVRKRETQGMQCGGVMGF